MYRHTLWLLSSTLLLGGVSCRPSLSAPDGTPPAATSSGVKSADAAWRPDYESIARKIVTQSVGVKEGDIVQILGGLQDMEFLEDLAANVRKLGAFPLLMVDTERLVRRINAETPAKFDKQEPRLDKKFAEMVDAMIWVDHGYDPSLADSLPPERQAAMMEAAAPIYATFKKRNVRYVWVGNDMYPSEARAKEFGVRQSDLARAFWEGCNADPARVQANARATAAKLSAGKVLHITHPNGTDLTMRIEGRPIIQNDGVLTPEDLAKGGIALTHALPAGEVLFAPVPGTAEGKVIVPRHVWRGKPTDNLTLTFSAGKLTGITAPTETETLRAIKEDYRANGEGKDVFGAVDIGVNPDIKIIPGSHMQTFVPAGMVQISVGGNLMADGENLSIYSLSGYLPGSTVTVDDAVLIENGQLKL